MEDFETEFISEHFLLRPVEVSDAPNLLRCYSDEEAVERMNADNCTSTFLFRSLSEMEECIRFWQEDGKRTGYIRYAVVDRVDERAVGTCELFPREQLGSLKNVGLLRLDLMSAYETEEVLTELFALFHREFYGPLRYLMTKAPAAATLRRDLLRNWGYAAVKSRRVIPFDGYWFQAERAMSLPYGCGGLACALCEIEDCPGCQLDEGLCGGAERETKNILSHAED